MATKPKYKTFYSKGGKMGFENEENDLSSIPERFSDWQDITVPREEIISDILKKFAVSAIKETHQYVTYEEFDELKRRFDKFEQKLALIIEEPVYDNYSAILNEIATELNKLSKRAYYKCSNNQLQIFTILSEFSIDLLDKISEIEVFISKQHPFLSIEIEPVLSLEDIPKDCHELLVKT
jgi:hypothetical protein